MKAIRVSSEAEFERLLDHISIEAFRATDYWRLLRGLDAAIDVYGREFSQTRAFWGFTFNALHEVVLSYLGRLYDKTPGALSLENFLQVVKSCAPYFSEESFRRRLQNDPNVESLAAGTRTLDVSALEAEILGVSVNEPLVKRLHDLRNKYVAHRDANMVRLASLSSLAGLTVTDVETLLDRATQIATKYSLLYRRSCLSGKVVGADDYGDLLQLLKERLDLILAEREEEIRRLKALAQGN
jgi:hypothetical protein